MVLMGIMMAIVTGVAIIPTGVAIIPTVMESGTSAALPLMLVTLIIIGATSWIGFSDIEKGQGQQEVTATDKALIWAKKHWRILAVVAVLLLAWSAVSLLGWNN